MHPIGPIPLMVTGAVVLTWLMWVAAVSVMTWPYRPPVNVLVSRPVGA